MFERLSQLTATKPQLLGIVAGALFLSALVAPRFGNPLCERIESWGARFAVRKRACVIGIACAAILLRLSFLPLIPVPVPEVHDEFCYLLAADTFAHGRLANPPHPLWVFFETFHVNQQPTYMAKYPPAQGTVLALGQLLGNPWIGVLLSMGLLCGTVVWALQGWLPPRWALLAGVLCVLKLAISSYWVNSYWGGSVAGIGGALVVGAMPRILRFARGRDAIILAIGVSILANSRPFEGAIFGLPVAVYLVAKITRKNLGLQPVLRMVSAVGIVIVLCLAFMAYYNRRVTGSALLFPYSLNDKTYLSTPSLAWQQLEPPKRYLNSQFDNYYNDGYMRKAWRTQRANTLPHAARVIAHNAISILHFYLWPELALPALALIPFVRDRKSRFFIVQGAICFVGYLLVTWWLLPHYSAPLTAGIFALVVQGARHIRQWSFGGRPIGIALTRAMVLAAMALCPFNLYWVNHWPSMRDRATIAASLEALPGKQLVLVHYPVDNWPDGEWVYNSADIDHSKIVWAREIPGRDIAAVLKYFSDRQVWEVIPGPPRTSLQMYRPTR